MSTYQDKENRRKGPKPLVILAALALGVFLVIQFRSGYPDQPELAKLASGTKVFELQLTPL